MRKVMVVLVAVLGLAGLVAVASAHMGDGGYSGGNGYGPGYGWNCGMGPGGMSHMGRMSNMGWMPHRTRGWDYPAVGTSAGPSSKNLRNGMRPGDGPRPSPGTSSPDTESGQ